MNNKVYYKIGEVAELLDVPQSTLRYWEKEFSEVSPKKNEKGTRFYTEENLKDLRIIKHLLKEKALTIEGTRLKLKENKTDVSNNFEIIEKLKNIREEILELRASFDKIMKNAEAEE